MFDTMTLTKAGGALCGALLIFLLGAWVAETIYHVGGDDHGAHGEGHSQAYVIPVEHGDDHGDEVEEEIDVVAVLGAGNAEDGSKLWRQCGSCHGLEPGVNGSAGPSLYGIVGRDVASEESFSYSGNLIAVIDVWTAEELFAFLEKPSEYAPDTAMSYRGMAKVTDRANLIAYLDSLDD